MYMLDTNICTYVINRRPPGVLRRFENLASDDLCISIITFAELHYGVERSSAQDRNRQIVDDFTSRLEVRPWDRGAALHYAEIRSALEAKGTPIGNMDLLIAAHARSGDCTLVSNNLREFRRIPRLKRENWAR